MSPSGTVRPEHLFELQAVDHVGIAPAALARTSIKERTGENPMSRLNRERWQPIVVTVVAALCYCLNEYRSPFGNETWDGVLFYFVLPAPAYQPRHVLRSGHVLPWWLVCP